MGKDIKEAEQMIEEGPVVEAEQIEEEEKANFTWIEKEIKGNAYLIGNDKKATSQFINAFVTGLNLPSGKATEVKDKLEEKLMIPFTFTSRIKKPNSAYDAILMLGKTAAEKMISTKVETNQLDKLRNEKSSELVKKANMAEIMGNLLK